MSTNVPGFQSFFRFLHPFVLAKLATSSARINREGYPHIRTTMDVVSVLVARKVSKWVG